MIEASATYKGIVTNNNDPENFNRVKFICPQVFGNSTTETDWAWPILVPGWTQASAVVQAHRSVAIYSGGGSGVSTPEMSHTLDVETPLPGQGVWVAFEGGDIEYPIWLGVWM
jgi:hypothetical protein